MSSTNQGQSFAEVPGCEFCQSCNEKVCAHFYTPKIYTRPQNKLVFTSLFFHFNKLEYSDQFKASLTITFTELHKLLTKMLKNDFSYTLYFKKSSFDLIDWIVIASKTFLFLIGHFRCLYSDKKVLTDNS